MSAVPGSVNVNGVSGRNEGGNEQGRLAQPSVQQVQHPPETHDTPPMQIPISQRVLQKDSSEKHRGQKVKNMDLAMEQELYKQHWQCERMGTVFYIEL